MSFSEEQHLRIMPFFHLFFHLTVNIVHIFSILCLCTINEANDNAGMFINAINYSYVE